MSFYKNYIVYQIVVHIRVMASYHFTKFCLSALNVLPEGVYYCFTRPTLFTTTFTVVILVYLLKYMCIPSFILIGSCVSELHAHLCL